MGLILSFESNFVKFIPLKDDYILTIRIELTYTQKEKE